MSIPMNRTETAELSRVHVTQAPPPQGRRRSEVDFCSNDLLAPCESAHGAVLHLFAENKSGEQSPQGLLNSAVSAVRSTALT